MIKDAYVQYQSRKAAKDLFDAMELLPGRVKMERDVHYIDDRYNRYSFSNWPSK